MGIPHRQIKDTRNNHVLYWVLFATRKHTIQFHFHSMVWEKSTVTSCMLYRRTMDWQPEAVWRAILFSYVEVNTHFNFVFVLWYNFSLKNDQKYLYGWPDHSFINFSPIFAQLLANIGLFIFILDIKVKQKMPKIRKLSFCI